MNLQWFALQTLTGHEQKVMRFLESERRHQGLEEYVGEVLMPTRKEVQVRKLRRKDRKTGDVREESKKMVIDRKLFPGYVFVEAAVYDESRKINERVWSFIRNTQGVIGFVGGDPPVPMKASDVENLRASVEGAGGKPQPTVKYEPGDRIRIVDGPFMSFNGLVQKADPNQSKLSVLVSIFGRETLVELENSQVERDESKSETAQDSEESAPETPPAP